MNTDLHLDIAVTKCFYCGGSNELLIARSGPNSSSLRLVKGRGKLEESVHNRVHNMQPCPKCEEWMKQGVILIGIDAHKSDPNWDKKPPGAEHWIPNPYRSGHFAVIKEESFRRIFSEGDAAEFGTKNRWMFIEQEVGEMIGIWSKTGEEPK